MANEEHVKTLRSGVQVWNRWRKDNATVRPILSLADLSCTDLSGANLRDANLSGADLRDAILSGTNLEDADLSGTNLEDANLRDADLGRADLSDADLSDADLARASLSHANLTRVDLGYANLSGADLSGADLRGAYLGDTELFETLFIDTSLEAARSLESCRHGGPSTIDHRTLANSGKLPIAFLRGCGLPDFIIDNIAVLQDNPLQFYSCFISHSSKDGEFAQRLHNDFQGWGVRCWYAPEDLKIGDRFRDRINEAIRVHDKLLLILSEQSVISDWVETEVEKALAEERRRVEVAGDSKPRPTVLFPVRLDDTAINTEMAWAEHIRLTRHIGDFTRWKDHDAYQKAFDRLLRDLKASA